MKNTKHPRLRAPAAMIAFGAGLIAAVSAA
jgi:hypothetical protein